MKANPSILKKFMSNNFKNIGEDQIYTNVEVTRERILKLYKQQQSEKPVKDNRSFLAVLSRPQDTKIKKMQFLNLQKINSPLAHSLDKQIENWKSQNSLERSQWQILKNFTETTNQVASNDDRSENSRCLEWRKDLSNCNTPVNSLLKLQFDSLMEQQQ